MTGPEVLRRIGLEPLIDFLEKTAYGVCITGDQHTWVYLNPAAEQIFGQPLAELYGQDYLLHFPEHERGPLLALESDQRGGDTGFYTNTVLRPDGREIEMTWSGSVITADGVELAPAIFHETTHVRRAHRAAIELASALHRAADEERASQLTDLLRETVDGTGARAAAALLADDQLAVDRAGGSVALRLVAGQHLPDDAFGAVAATGMTLRDLPGAADVERGRTVFLADATARYGSAAATTQWAQQLTLLGTTGAAQVPIWRDGAVTGVLLVLFPPEVTAPTEAQLAFLASMADRASLLLGADSAQRSRHQAARHERKRIARDLHDSVSQGLFSVLARAQVVRRALGAGDLELALAAAADLESLSREATTQMRELLTGLRDDGTPGHLPELVDLGDGLRDLAARVTQREPLSVQVRLPEALPELAVPVTQHLLRIAGEAVHNVVKHAGASTVLVAVSVPPGELVLEVQDDGCGFDPDVPGRGLGQRTMDERARLCGGTFEVRRREPSGTVIRVAVPL